VEVAEFFPICLVSFLFIMDNVLYLNISGFGFAGYYCVDRDSTAEKVVFNRTVTLRDSYKPTKPVAK
jgi:hypothetical protein